jgi:hypothetical protein
MSAAIIPPALDGARLLPVPAGEKALHRRGWPDLRPSRDEVLQHLARGGNVAMRLGRASGDLVDADLDCAEAMTLADLYLPQAGAVFGRPSKPRSHRLYRARGAVFAAFADPLDGSMLLELQADGRDGGAHLTLIPPSVSDGQRRAWDSDTIEPAEIVELDAIEPDQLRTLVREVIEQHLPPDQYKVLKVAEESERRLIRELVGAIKDAQ